MTEQPISYNSAIHLRVSAGGEDSWVEVPAEGGHPVVTEKRRASLVRIERPDGVSIARREIFSGDIVLIRGVAGPHDAYFSLPPGADILHATISSAGPRTIFKIIGVELRNGVWTERNREQPLRLHDYVQLKQIAGDHDLALSGGDAPRQPIHLVNIANAAPFRIELILEQLPEWRYYTFKIDRTRNAKTLGDALVDAGILQKVAEAVKLPLVGQAIVGEVEAYASSQDASSDDRTYGFDLELGYRFANVVAVHIHSESPRGKTEMSARSGLNAFGRESIGVYTFVPAQGVLHGGSSWLDASFHVIGVRLDRYEKWKTAGNCIPYDRNFAEFRASVLSYPLGRLRTD